MHNQILLLNWVLYLFSKHVVHIDVYRSAQCLCEVLCEEVMYMQREKRRDLKRPIGIMIVFIKDCLLKGYGRRLIGIMTVFIKDCLLKGMGEDLLE